MNLKTFTQYLNILKFTTLEDNTLLFLLEVKPPKTKKGYSFLMMRSLTSFVDKKTTLLPFWCKTNLF